MAQYCCNLQSLDTYGIGCQPSGPEKSMRSLETRLWCCDASTLRIDYLASRRYLQPGQFKSRLDTMLVHKLHCTKQVRIRSPFRARLSRHCPPHHAIDYESLENDVRSLIYCVKRAINHPFADVKNVRSLTQMRIHSSIYKQNWIAFCIIWRRINSSALGNRPNE
jgi:hypothetical protein